MEDIIHPNNDIQKIVEILIIIKNKINSKTDIAWTGYSSPQELINHLEAYINYLRLNQFEFMGDISMRFGPTGTFQELSISNDWGDEFLKLAQQFDYHHKNFLSQSV